MKEARGEEGRGEGGKESVGRQRRTGTHLFASPPPSSLSHSFSPSLPPSRQRFKSMDRFCFVDGDMGGSLRLHVQNDRCHVQTFYG